MSRIFRPYKSFPTQKYYKTLPEKEWFGQPNGIATLDENGKLVSSQLPGGGITPGGDSHNKGWFVNPSALPTTGENGDYAIVGTTDTIWVWDSDTNKWVNTGVANAIKTVNGIGPDNTGNISLSAENITDLNIGDDGRTITIGTKSVTPLTSDSTIAANKIDGTVNNALEATKAYQDGNGDNIANTYVKISDFTNALAEKQDKTDANLITADKTIVGAINEIFNKDNILSDTYKTEISTGSTTGFLLMPNGDNYVKPEIDQFVDYKIKIFAKSVDNTKFEKYSVNFFAINNNDTLTITSSPTCESVSVYGGSLINNVDVKSDTEDSTKIQFYVTTTSDNVVLYTSLNKTIINNII